MTATTTESTPKTTTLRDACVRAAVVFVVCGLWTTLLWFAPAKDWPIAGDVRRAFFALLAPTGIPKGLIWAVRGVVFTALGLLLIRLALRRPLSQVMLHETHVPPDIRRLVVLALLVALPVQIALGLWPGMHTYYRKMFGNDGWVPLLANTVTIFTEHLWIEGAVLGLALPAAVRLSSSSGPRQGRLARFGLGYIDQEPRTLCTWLGLPTLAWPAIVVQGVLFFMIHFTKDPFEVATSLPGGLAVGWLSYRARSFWPGMILHVVTGSVVVLTMWLSR